MITPHGVYTKSAAARLLGVSTYLIDRMISAGQLSVVRISRREMIPGNALLRVSVSIPKAVIAPRPTVRELARAWQRGEFQGEN